MHASVVITILIFTIIPETCAEESIRVEALQEDAGIYFEDCGTISLFNNKWKMLVYFNMGTYNSELKNIRWLVNNIYLTCEKAKSSHIGNYCDSLIQILKIQFQNIELTNELISSKNIHDRRKRAAFGIIGSVSKSLFGTLNEDDAEYYSGLISDLREDNTYLVKLIQNQTSILDTTVNVVQQTEDSINTQFSSFQNQLNQINTLMNIVNKDNEKNNITQTFNMLSSLAILKILNYKDTQNSLLEVLTDIKHNKINPSLFTPRQLKQQLDLIQQHLPMGTSLPNYNDVNQLLEIYQLMQVRTGRVKNRLLIELNIPLLRNTPYQLYKVVPIPFFHQESYLTIIPDTSYIAVDSNKLNYYPMSDIELSHCTSTNSMLICSQMQPIYTVNSERFQCEVKLMNHEKSNLTKVCKFQSMPLNKHWIRLNHPNKWIYVLDKAYTIDIACNKVLTYVELKGSGVIDIAPGCKLRNNDITIHSHNIQQNEPINSYFPAFNLTEIKIKFSNNTGKILIPSVTLTPDIMHEQLKKLSHDIEVQKKANVLPTMSNRHDVHHYTMTYVNLSLYFCAAAACFLVYKKFRGRKDNSTNINESKANTEPTNKDISISNTNSPPPLPPVRTRAYERPAYTCACTINTEN